jgi:hypothetical protein
VLCANTAPLELAGAVAVDPELAAAERYHRVLEARSARPPWLA